MPSHFIWNANSTISWRSPWPDACSPIQTPPHLHSSALLPVSHALTLLFISKICYTVSLWGLGGTLEFALLPACTGSCPCSSTPGFFTCFRSQHKSHRLKGEIPKDPIKNITPRPHLSLRYHSVISFKLFVIIKLYIVYLVHLYIVYLPRQLECKLHMRAMSVLFLRSILTSPQSSTVWHNINLLKYVSE